MLLRRNHVTNRALFQRMIRLLFICLITITLYPSAGHTSPGNSAQTLRIYTAIAPLAFIIEQIGGSHLTVETLLTRGQDPHLFEPGPRLLHRLSKADMYLMSGLPFERILKIMEIGQVLHGEKNSGNLLFLIRLEFFLMT